MKKIHTYEDRKRTKNRKPNGDRKMLHRLKWPKNKKNKGFEERLKKKYIHI